MASRYNGMIMTHTHQNMDQEQAIAGIVVEVQHRQAGQLASFSVCVLALRATCQARVSYVQLARLGSHKSTRARVRNLLFSKVHESCGAGACGDPKL